MKLLVEAASAMSTAVGTSLRANTTQLNNLKRSFQQRKKLMINEKLEYYKGLKKLKEGKLVRIAHMS
jgi:uncharacterized protein YgiM (DUF1202 family)